MAYILFEERLKTKIGVFDGNNSLLCKELNHLEDILSGKVNLDSKNVNQLNKELNSNKQQLINQKLLEFKGKYYEILKQKNEFKKQYNALEDEKPFFGAESLDDIIIKRNAKVKQIVTSTKKAKVTVYENALYINHMLRPLQKQVLDKIFAHASPGINKTLDMIHLEHLKEIVISDIYLDKSFASFLQNKFEENFENIFCM